MFNGIKGQGRESMVNDSNTCDVELLPVTLGRAVFIL